MKTYVVTLSKTFPKGHPRAGQPTNFKESYLTGKKIHTIRGNLVRWQKIFKEINAGIACLSLREWIGIPYRSKQVEIDKLTSCDGIGLQSIMFLAGWLNDVPLIFDYRIDDRKKDCHIEDIASNDGLDEDDLEDWMLCDYKSLSQPMALIHFTKFRY